jgi:3-oxoisoapionate decarboxylase
MVLGISSYTYTWGVGVPGSMPGRPFTAYDLIDKSAITGLRLVQIADNLPLEEKPVTELKSILNYANSKKVSIEMGSRGLTPDHTYSCLKTAEELNSPILRMVIDKPGYEPDIQSVIGIIRDLLKEFESRKIKLAIENHDRFKAAEFEKIMHSVDSEWVGICLDSVNSMGAGEGFASVSRLLLPYTINLHIKDFSISRLPHKMGLLIEGRPAGKGMLNIKELLDNLYFTNSCQSAILELWTPPEKTIDETILKEERWANESINYLKSVMK